MTDRAPTPQERARAIADQLFLDPEWDKGTLVLAIESAIAQAKAQEREAIAQYLEGPNGCWEVELSPSDNDRLLLRLTAAIRARNP